MATENNRLRAIVIGGGVTGLVASHALQKANIDHVVLERRNEVAPPEGASIAMWPHGSRILHQIGCFEAARDSCVPMDRWKVRDSNGKEIMDNNFFRNLHHNHGSDMLLLERRNFLQLLYDNLPDKSHVRLGSKISDIKHTDEGIEVHLANGDVEKGDIVIGCDGVYSTTRNFMWDHASRVTPGLITLDEKRRLKTQWKSLLGIAPPTPGLGKINFNVTSANGNTFLGMAQPDQVYFFFIFHTDEKFSWPKRVNYTEEDAERLAAEHADYGITDTMTFGELWKTRTRGALVNLEEGVLDHWHSGRIVLAGDAAHKVTPNMALGGNSGMESVAVLCNQLNRLQNETPAGQKPSAAAITAAFDRYQERRKPRMHEISKTSALITRVHAWDSPMHKFLSTWVLPMQPDSAMATLMGNVIKGGEKLDYVDDSTFPSGAMPFEDKEDNGKAGAASGSSSMVNSMTARVVGGMAAVGLAVQGARMFK
jgi:2-polyprenyl-6-methoxyphenol hydroxylase-like FAD-dependent oxidoreductase